MSSKKNRKKIRAQYEHNANLDSKEKHLKSSLNIKINNPKLRTFMEKMIALMKRKNNFYVFLKKLTQGKFVGAYAQSGNYNDNFEVMPDCDEIHFYKHKNGVLVRYIRVYSDFPSSVTDFMLSEVEKVVEVLPT
ncbi:MAG TPA: hypothetical protein VIK86_09225 [Candidatus Paceibacterota bacterium]